MNTDRKRIQLTLPQSALLDRAVELGQVLRPPKHQPARRLVELGFFEQTTTLQRGASLHSGGAAYDTLSVYIPTSAGRAWARDRVERYLRRALPPAEAAARRARRKETSARQVQAEYEQLIRRYEEDNDHA